MHLYSLTHVFYSLLLVAAIADARPGFGAPEIQVLDATLHRELKPTAIIARAAQEEEDFAGRRGNKKTKTATVTVTAPAPPGRTSTVTVTIPGQGGKTTTLTLPPETKFTTFTLPPSTKTLTLTLPPELRTTTLTLPPVTVTVRA